MDEARYLKKASTGKVFLYTPILAERLDMVECDEHGNLLGIAGPGNGPVYDDGQPLGDELKTMLNEMSNKALIVEYLEERWGIRLSDTLKREELVDQGVRLGDLASGQAFVAEPVMVDHAELSAPREQAPAGTSGGAAIQL